MANKRRQTTTHRVAKFYPLYLAVTISRYGSLINIYPFDIHEVQEGNHKLADFIAPKKLSGLVNRSDWNTYC